MTDEFWQASALCGAVGYAVPDEFLYALNCHCTQCRRCTGAAFKPIAGIEKAKLRLIRGADEIVVHGGDVAHDVRCARCGSLLYSLVREGTFVHVAMGSLTDEPTIRPGAHTFVGSRAAWFTITDGLSQYDELP